MPVDDDRQPYRVWISIRRNGRNRKLENEPPLIESFLPDRHKGKRELVQK